MGKIRGAISMALLSLVLMGCGMGSARRNSSTATDTSTSTDDFAVSTILPASSEVSSLPTTVVVTFNQNFLAPTATTLGYYNLSCAGDVFEASAVQNIYGSNVVTVTLPSVGPLPAGTACYFSISPHVTNEEGYPTIGVRSTAYYLR